MIWHSSDVNSVLSELNSDFNNGIPNGVAYERLETFGKNQIIESKTVGFFRRFLRQLNSKSVYALIIVSIICFIVSLIYKQSDYYSPFLIIAIILLNALVTAYLQHKCDRAMLFHKALTVPYVTVIREGIKRNIPSSELVIGDVIILSDGDYIPADARLIETSGFRCNELIITGDKIPVEKDASVVLEDMVPVAGRKNMVYSGCSVIHGSARAVVVETGLNTELGKTSSINSQTGADVSIIEKTLNNVARITNISVFCICAVIFLISLAMFFSSNRPFASVTAEMLLNSIALGVCAIPESLPFITVIVTSLGITRLIGEGIYLKNSSILEKLGKTTVICADKTGILTSKNMAVNYIYDGEDITKVSDMSANQKSAVVLRLAVCCSMLESDFTENAIEKACLDCNSQTKTDINNIYPRLASIPFDSERKMMTSINMIDGQPFAIVKGAPETLLDKCVGIDKDSVNKICNSLASNAMRLICIAIKALDEIPANPIPENIECDLKFAGIICLEDPPRPETVTSINECKIAGIKTIMITGDNITTALAVARELGISDDTSAAITGVQIEEMSDEDLLEKVGSYSVFARISSAQKFRIIKALKDNGNIVTVTGTGSDDADVLSVADVGCAVGRVENDVAIGNSDVVIQKNSFSYVVDAIKECRGLFDSIKKTVYYLFSCNISEILIYFFGLLIFKMPPVLAAHLLWINLLTDAAPAISLAVQPADNQVMKSPPITIRGKIFDLNSVIKITVDSIVLTVCAIVAFAIGNIYSRSVAYTMIFLTMSLSQIFHAFNLKSKNSIIYTRFKSNEFLVYSTIITAFISIFLCLTPAGSIFGFKILTAGQLITSLGLSVIIIPICEAIKLFELKKSI